MADDFTDQQKSARHLLSANLKRIRKAQGLSQERFADLCGLHRTFVSQIEREVANATVDTLTLLANTLKVELAELFFISPGEVTNLKAGRPLKAQTETVEARRHRKAK
ncbi:helix-turn-helix domain-containing protein [Paraburkholderia lycopersici]|uniref:helix-turn-helix domain-containing protein n=1 Tax=Paraburkholderia lycopersici TaxID=416944 RepID=UPI000B86AC44